ncbi:MAG: ABC transporter substrate-binding protein [Streptosporangiaceae bacterium]
MGEALAAYKSGGLSRRSFFKTAGAFGISASAVSTLLAACSSASSPAASGANTGKPVRGGTFREGYDRDFTPPNTVNSAWADPDYNALFEAVIMRDPQGNMVPMLADSFTSSPNGWTFHLREGLKFQSGAPVTADAVATDFKIFSNMKMGANAVFWAPITDVTTDGQNVVCHTKHSFRAFQETVCTEYSYIMNPVTWKAQGASYGTKPTDGTGPFVLASYVPGQHVVAKRWEGYPGSIVPFFTNKGKAYVDSIEWIPITQASQRAPQIQTNLVDAVKNVPPQDIDSLKGNSNLVVLEFQELSNIFLSVNLADSSLGFTDVRVRRAISQAINREEIVKSILLGHGAATYGPIMPNYKWYNPAVEQYNHYDPGTSKQLLDAAGWTVGSGGIRQKNGKRLAFTTYHLSTDPEDQVLEAVTAMLANVGIQMTVVNLSQASFFPKVTPSQTSYAYKWLWSSPIDVAEYFVAYDQPKTSIINDVYAAYDAWQHADTVDALKSAAYSYQVTFAKELPLIPIYTPNTTWAHTNNVVGWQPNQANLYPFYNDVWLKNG